MDEHYQYQSRDPISYIGSIQPSTESGLNYNYNEIGRSSLYGQESELRRFQYRNKASPSYLVGDRGQGYLSSQGSQGGVEGQLGLKKRHKSHHRHERRRSHHKHRKKKYCKCWRNFQHFFRRKSKRHRHRHKKRKHHHRHRRRSQELISVPHGPPTYPPSPPTMTPTDTTPLPTPDKTTSPAAENEKEKVKEEKAEEKVATKEKKSASMEAAQEKESKVSKTKTAEDLRKPAEDEQHIICIDQTRVVLKGDEDSDFIHANRVPLGDNPNEIIITQLPLSNTVKHFWEMIWQENVQAILLLLTLNEWKEHAENIQLIPGKGRCLHIEDFLMLTHKNEVRVTPDWIVHEFYLSKNDETRRILWHHYSSWEPNRPPADGEHLWPIHSSLRKMRRPYVCISLAGAGRAGSYAALEWAHLMLHDKGAVSINIPECIRKVRSYRMHSVQTIAQYQFIYMGILRHIFIIEKIRKEILSDPITFEQAKKCSAVEYKYYKCGGYPEDDDLDL